MTYAWTALLSLVPARYRARSSFEGSQQLYRAALFCGIFQVVLFAFVYIGAFISESTGIWEQTSGVVLNAERGPTMDPVQVRLTTGMLGAATFVLQPLHLFYAYMVVEGATRAFSAFAFARVLPTLPLSLISLVHDAIEAPAKKRKAAFLARDVMEPARDDSYDLHVLSHLPKDWTPHIGIQFRGELFLLAGEERGPEPRPFGYKLRKNPSGNLVVVTRHYEPERETTARRRA
jgi:hypothetical protein